MTTVLDKRLTAARADLADERLRGLVRAARFVAGVPRRVVAPVAPVRRAPGGDAPLDTEAQFGEAVTVFEEADGFAWAQLGSDGYVGYCPATALGPPGPEPTHRVAALRSFLYPGPDMKLPATGFLGLGARVTPDEMREGFSRLPEGGWLFAGHLRPVSDREPDFVAVASRLVGTPYLWGGRTSLGLDCSGLVQIALGECGVAAPRDSDMQAAALGSAVEVAPDLAGLRRGDLVFWRGHVGIMVDEANLLHANAHHMAVAIESLAEAETRIRTKSFGAIAAVRRLAQLPLERT